MNLCVLHISDLHRDPHNPIGNRALFDSLENDHRHYTTEQTPAIRSPDIVIVSGDIIHGVKHDASDAIDQLKAQYGEALTFLDELTKTFVEGDRERVIIVPGNHDVSSHHFFASLEAIKIAPSRSRKLVEQLFSRDSLLRWEWSEFQLYEIAHRSLYDQRLASFAEFYETFYEGRRKYSLDPANQFDIFDFPAFGLTITGFSSCHNNDIFNKQGDIHPDCITQAGQILRTPAYEDRLRVAVWHHNTEGEPMQSDYMDPDIVQNLIDRGFSLAFHGHQHRPQFLDTRFRHGIDRRMTVISAGTLCGGPAYRFPRAYNVIEFDTTQRKGRLHLRTMQNDRPQLPIWGPGTLPPNTESHIDFDYDAPPEPAFHGNRETEVIVAAEELYERGQFGDAVDLLLPIAGSDDLARRLLFASLEQLSDKKAIIANFYPPQSPAEAIALIDALWEEDRAELVKLLETPYVANTDDPSLIEIRDKYAMRLSK